jgi:hypothetical protein
MIDFQSSCDSAGVLDCGSPLPLSHCIRRSGFLPHGHSAIPSKFLCASASLWQKFPPQSIVKFALLAPEIPNPGQIQQSYPSLSKPLPQRGEIARMGSLQLFAPICAFFRKKKIVYFSCRADGPSANQPKSTPASQKANQMQAEADQKRKSPLDSGCEPTAFRTETCNFLRPAPTYLHLLTAPSPLLSFSLAASNPAFAGEDGPRIWHRLPTLPAKYWPIPAKK